MRSDSVVMSACLVLALVGGGCSKAPAEAKVEDVTKVPCKEDTNKNIAAGKPSRCILTADFAVGPYTCKNAHIISFHATGALDDCTLTAPTPIAELSCQESFQLYPDGKLKRCKLTADATKSKVAVKAGNWVTLSPTGNLRRLEAKAPQPMGAFSCQGYFNYFHENGQLARCDLAAPADVGGKPRAAKESVCWDDKGAPLADCKALVLEAFMR